MTRVILAGASGRMGQEIQRVSNEMGIQIVAGLTRTQSSLKSAASKSGKPDVVIDFSLPEATRTLLEECKILRVPLVSGVTGYSAVQLAELKLASKEIAVLHSNNMSLGVQILAKALDALKGIAAMDAGYDFQIEETHHVHKKDKPSGTALLLRDEMRARLGREPSAIHSHREGDVIGEHKVVARSQSEVIVLQHSALDRAVFARGACRAARWLAGRESGFFSLRDVLESD